VVSRDGTEPLLVLPVIRRARGWRLYDQQGKRYLDFAQARGSAFLGHPPRNAVRVMKQELDRGLLSALPNRWEQRLVRVLARLAAVAGVTRLTLDESTHVWWPLSGFQTPTGWIDQGEGDVTAHIAAPGIPLVTTPVSPVILAAVVTGLYALDGYLGSPAAEERIALARRLPVPPGYRLRGVLMSAEVPPEDREYQEIRRRALERGIILPLEARDPILVPGVLTAGEIGLWEELCERWI